MHPTTLPDSGNTHDPYDIGFYTNQLIFKDYPKYFICNAYFHDDVQGFPILMHNHSFYEINIVTSGSGWHYIENQCIKAKLGSVFVIPPNVRHGYYTEDPHSFNIFHILLSSYFMGKYKEELESIEGYKTMFEIEPTLRSNLRKTVFLILSENELSYFEKDFTELTDFSKNQSYANNVAIVGKTIYLISRLCSLLLNHHGDILRKNAPDNNSRIDILNILSSIEYIQNNFAQKITIDDLAKNAKMSRSLFIKQFELYTKKTVNDYVINTRIEKSLNLLDSNYSISYIAQECGFFDSSHFSRYFKKVTGKTPLEYKKSVIVKKDKNIKF